MAVKVLRHAWGNVSCVVIKYCHQSSHHLTTPRAGPEILLAVRVAAGHTSKRSTYAPCRTLFPPIHHTRRLWNAAERVSGTSSESRIVEVRRKLKGRMTRFKNSFGEDIAADQWHELQAGAEGQKEPAMVKEMATKGRGTKRSDKVGLDWVCNGLVLYWAWTGMQIIRYLYLHALKFLNEIS
jgi:hypothetical protein